MPSSAISRIRVRSGDFNANVVLPYGLTTDAVKATLNESHDFVYHINRMLFRKIGLRLEDILMPATFSGMLSGFIVRQLSHHSSTMTRNLYHNGHPDLVPVNRYPGNSVQYGHEGVEVKTSRYASGWQGHNPEKIWIMIFRYDNDPFKPEKDTRPLAQRSPFRMVEVLAAELEKSDWSAQGRRSGSRRTPTASIVRSGTKKLRANWIYRNPDFAE